MTTLDKINSELSSLQKELTDLQHYTKEIGKAKDAATSVVKMSQEFISSFQKRVEEINKEMLKASSEFAKKCNDTSKNFEEASKIFQKGISDAKATLNDVGAELAIVSEKVNDLAVKIESIDILGHFNKIHTSLVEMQGNNDKMATNINANIQILNDQYRLSSKKIKNILIVVSGCLILALILVAFIAYKVA